MMGWEARKLNSYLASQPVCVKFSAVIGHMPHCVGTC